MIMRLRASRGPDTLARPRRRADKRNPGARGTGGGTALPPGCWPPGASLGAPRARQAPWERPQHGSKTGQEASKTAKRPLVRPQEAPRCLQDVFFMHFGWPYGDNLAPKQHPELTLCERLKTSVFVVPEAFFMCPTYRKIFTESMNNR